MVGEALGGPSLGTPELVVTGVHRDPVDPGPNRRPALELARLAKHSEECFLGRIEGLLTVSQDAEAHREHPVLVISHHCVECIPVSGDDPSQQLGFVAGDRHGVNRTSPSSP